MIVEQPVGYGDVIHELHVIVRVVILPVLWYVFECLQHFLLDPIDGTVVAEGIEVSPHLLLDLSIHSC